MIVFASLRVMLKFFLRLTILCSLLPLPANAFDDLKQAWNVDLLYHYSRMERATLLQTDNIQSRQGIMLQFEYEDQIDLFWRWYFGGDFTFARYEAAPTVIFSPQEQFPAQIYLGTGFQLGALKSFEIFFGLGGATEHYLTLTGPNTFDFKNEYSARAHLGFSWRFLSITGATAKLLARYSLPVTEVDHSGTSLSYRGILDGTLRIRGSYDSLFSLYGGVRFEDYRTSNQGITYFITRIYAGFGLHFH